MIGRIQKIEEVNHGILITVFVPKKDDPIHPFYPIDERGDVEAYLGYDEIRRILNGDTELEQEKLSEFKYVKKQRFDRKKLREMIKYYEECASVKKHNSEMEKLHLGKVEILQSHNEDPSYTVLPEGGTASPPSQSHDDPSHPFFESHQTSNTSQEYEGPQGPSIKGVGE